MNDELFDAMAALDIPSPSAGYRAANGFTRYGKGKRYYLKQTDDVAFFGDWVSGKNGHYFSDDDKTLTPAETDTRKRKLAELRKECGIERQQKYEDVAILAAVKWHKLSETGISSYLQRKQVAAYGVRFDGSNVVIPLRDVEGKLWSYQRIMTDGQKRFLAGGRKTGCYHAIGEIQGESSIFIVEGYSTGASVHEATGRPVIVAFDAGNLEPVIAEFRKVYPDIALTIAGDNDAWKERNIGKTKAKELAKKYDCKWMVPKFEKEHHLYQPTDFNDLHCLSGIESVKRQLLAKERKTGYRASELQYMDFPPIKWVVDGYIVEGLTIFAGKPKIGKSWMCLDIALAVASGGKAFGGVDCEQGEVLYLALEDNMRRLKSRIEQILPHKAQQWPESLELHTDWSRCDDGGVEKISGWIENQKNPRLIIIDTLAKVKGERKSSDSNYDGDYRSISELQSLASENGVAVIIVHHTRKMEAEDPLEKISGTMGLSGAADSVLVLDSRSGNAVLYGRGRDIEEIETAVEFNKEYRIWELRGDISALLSSPERKEILECTLKHGKPMKLAEITAALGKDNNNTRQLVYKMAKDGELKKPSRGYYLHPDISDNNDNKITLEGDASDESYLVTDVIGTLKDNDA